MGAWIHKGRAAARRAGTKVASWALITTLGVSPLVGAPGIALAQGNAPAQQGPSGDRVRVDASGNPVTIPGGRPSSTDLMQLLVEDPNNPPGTPDKATVASAAARLGVDPAALQLGVEGLGHVYAREYGDAEQLFNRVTREYPESAVGPFGHVLLYQSWMLENYDFSKEAQWTAATSEGIKRAEAEIGRGVAGAWNEFVRGSLMGIESIYQLRKGQYLPALNNALKAVSALERSMELDPEFKDPALCMGVYNYWRSVLTDRYWFLPSFGDHRQEGFQQLLAARDKGIFTGPGARLALAYSYLEERQVNQARDMCKELSGLYPDNVINNLLLGRIAMREGKLRHAKWYFKRVKDVSPENWLVEYYLGLTDMRERRYPTARDHFLAFLSHEGDVGGMAWAHYRLGDVYWQLYQDDAAKKEWQAAVSLESTLKGAQRRLDGQTPTRGNLPPPRDPVPVNKSEYQPSVKKAAPPSR